MHAAPSVFSLASAVAPTDFVLNVLRGFMTIAANFTALGGRMYTPTSCSAGTIGGAFLQKSWKDIKKLRQMSDLVFACSLIWRRYLGLY
jgi:hypothetical protein